MRGCANTVHAQYMHTSPNPSFVDWSWYGILIAYVFSEVLRKRSIPEVTSHLSIFRYHIRKHPFIGLPQYLIWRLRLKFSIIFTALAIFSGQAFATCNTVMGGCTTEQAVNVAPHMRSDNNKATAPTPSAPSTNAAAVNKNIKNANTSTPASKPATKKM